MTTKEVYFDRYCPKCVHTDKDATEDPCFDCLNCGFNYDSHKPVYFEEDEKKKEKETGA